MNRNPANYFAEVDEDARLLRKPGSGTIAGYNVQSAVDGKHKLLVVCEVTQDGNDEKQLEPISKQTKSLLDVETLEITADVGYFNVQGIKNSLEAGIIPYVSEPDRTSAAKKQGRFPREDFRYDKQANVYICPAEEELKHSTTVERNGKVRWLYRSATPICASCPMKEGCLPKKSKVRTITRWEHEDIIDAHRKRMVHQGAEKMRQRAGLCEHPFLCY